MADVRKTVTLNEGGPQEPVEQGWGETNAEVTKLFRDKIDLIQVTLDFAPGSETTLKVYERIEHEG